MVPFAHAVAAKCGAELILLHVEKDRELTKVSADPFRELNIRRVLYEGDPADIIIGSAKSEKIDLIVMPTRGYGAFRRFLIGSVTAKVLHDVECPVLTGAHLEEQEPVKDAQFHAVLCAIDLGPQSSEALKWASELAADWRARLDVAHALPVVGRGRSVIPSNPWRAEVANITRQGVDRAISAAGAVAAGIYVEEGEPAKTVCSLAKKLGSGLLVIGRGLRDPMGGRLAAQAYSIVRQSPCPVISI
jgi:nucleotide-binding universal stress UspA family protein